jgi:FkbM family methyltransferase
MSALVYDIGLHDGADTAHYLREGSRVVAVDANPAMCAAAETHFRHNIHTGQLTIINRGLAEHKGQLEFWVCDDVSEWSSFHRDIASRNGAKHHATTVDCVPIMDIVDEFGVADYMKIDIEGNDRICIAGLTNAAAPPYISVEMDHARGDRRYSKACRTGVSRFQVDMPEQLMAPGDHAEHLVLRVGPNHRIVRRVKRWKSAVANRLHGRRQGESGPWGEKTSGSWHSLDHALAVWRSLHKLDERLGTQGLGWWFDVHARK